MFFHGQIAAGLIPMSIRASSCENLLFAYPKTKTQIIFAVTAKLISAFVFATRIVQSLYLLNPKFQASRHILWLYSPVCVGPCRKPRRPSRVDFEIFRTCEDEAPKWILLQTKHDKFSVNNVFDHRERQWLLGSDGAPSWSNGR